MFKEETFIEVGYLYIHVYLSYYLFNWIQHQIDIYNWCVFLILELGFYTFY